MERGGGALCINDAQMRDLFTEFVGDIEPCRSQRINIDPNICDTDDSMMG